MEGKWQDPLIHNTPGLPLLFYHFPQVPALIHSPIFLNSIAFVLPYVLAPPLVLPLHS